LESWRSDEPPDIWSDVIIPRLQYKPPWQQSLFPAADTTNTITTLLYKQNFKQVRLATYYMPPLWNDLTLTLIKEGYLDKLNDLKGLGEIF